jgi:hypothetical protein
MSDQPRQLGERHFPDGTTRPVFEAADGRQYIEDDGEHVYGTSLPPADGLAIIDAAQLQRSCLGSTVLKARQPLPFLKSNGDSLTIT